MVRHTAIRATSSRAASQIAAEYKGLDRRDSTALNLSATSTALTIEEGRAVEQAGAIGIIKEMGDNGLKKMRRKYQVFIGQTTTPEKRLR